ncbi:MAG: DUF6505 family protein [Alphaproteobacteria bacterium]|nr:DUF6505 family protein [Alphaproteobacteria bacterium]
MLFPRTIRFDRSDEFVFERAAKSGELAVSGSFAFVHVDPDPVTWSGKLRQAFGSGLLGTESFGWATFVAIAEVEQDEYETMIERLAVHFVEHYGAPSRDAALAAARAEAEFAAELCEHKLNTLLAVERSIGEEGIVERFKVVQPPSRNFMAGRVWDVVEGADDG